MDRSTFRMSTAAAGPPLRLIAPSDYSTVPQVLVVIMLRRHLKSNDIYRHYIHFVILLTLESAQRLDVNLAMIDLTSSGEPKTTPFLTQQRRTVSPNIYLR